MPFLYKPSQAMLLAERLLPVGLRTTLLQMSWAIAAMLVVLAPFAGVTLQGVTLIILGLTTALTFGYLFFAYGLEEPLLNESLEDAVLRAQGGDNVSVNPWCEREVMIAFPIRGAASVSRVLANLLAQKRAEPIVQRLGIDRDQLVKALNALEQRHQQPPPKEVVTAFTDAAEHAMRHGHERIRFADALVAFARASKMMQEMLFNQELSIEDFDAVAHWSDRIQSNRESRRRFWTREYLFAVKPLGREWAYGYTPTIDRFAIDLTESMEARATTTSRTLGHLHEIATLERSLAKTSGTNALVVYEPGIGIRDVLGGFSARILSGRSLPILNYRRVLVADFGAAIAGLKTAGEIEGRIRTMLAEASAAGGTILVIENFHQLLGGEIGGQPIDLTATFLPFLQGSRIQIVATTTFGGLHETIEKREGMMALFERIEAKEPDAELTIQILLESLPYFERRFNMFVAYAILKEVVDLSAQTIQDVPFPKKALDVLEEAMIAAMNEDERVLTRERVAAVVSERTHIPVGALTETEQHKLQELESLLHQRVVGQEHAISQIANALRRARAGVRGGSVKRPIGAFLFMGPTGVGKTETAKAIAEVYFGSEEAMLRLDMSEFQGADAVDRLIGSPATKEEGRLSTIVREHPFSVLLLDEFEKMHKSAMDLFLPVFDEGEIRDGWDRRVVFTNVLIIATSNAGAEFIREWLERSGDDEGLAEALREEVLRRGIFRPELLNRFDGTIVYKPLTREQVREIAQRMLKRFSDTLYEEKGIRVNVSEDALKDLITRGFRQEFGARELRRVLQDGVETVVANHILAGRARRGDTVTVTLEDLQK